MTQHGNMQAICDYVDSSESQRFICGTIAVICLAVALPLLLNPVAPIVIAGFSISMFMVPLLIGAVSSLYAYDCHLCVKHFDNLTQSRSVSSEIVRSSDASISPVKSDVLQGGDRERAHSDGSTASHTSFGSDLDDPPASQPTKGPQNN